MRTSRGLEQTTPINFNDDEDYDAKDDVEEEWIGFNSRFYANLKISSFSL